MQPSLSVLFLVDQAGCNQSGMVSIIQNPGLRLSNMMLATQTSFLVNGRCAMVCVPQI